MRTVKFGFIAAGMINIVAVLLFSRAFTNSVINDFDPVVMSNFGLLMIMVWGLVFLGAAKVTSGINWLAGAFAVEKLAYVVAWLLWFKDNNLGVVFEQDLFAGVFYSIYGLNDFIFMVFFGWVFFTQGKSIKSVA
ncbi:hypothetical protein [Pseudoalteromonas luteoviolacea]|uniref:Uncharacterized protein n=1 Tax=Pseudoalteromonas luteoviolacea NCIMB 1942 TaxID=1365253 RepID=A0A167G0L4_9GAMM|nr:hypothetical protein [Pseudoalteromonas luteoviolacea]KZN53715.1 hypothetical protein N482_24790 [Pseudoalteromonas luteoviolacea NCIMB 1942]KZW99198.1 hypothetical protein JL49_18655 [Pseudoalteromonas luteoviolacea]